MSKKTLIIKQTGQIVVIERKWPWSSVIITLDGRDIGHFNSLKDLRGGQMLKTPIGDISVELKRGGFEAWHDGQILESDPSVGWRMGYKVAIGLGVFNILIGLIAISSKNSFLTSIVVGPYSFAFGIVLLFLGVWAWGRRSSIALWIAAIIFGGDGVLGVIYLLQAHATPNIFGLMLRAAFVMAMAQGAKAAEKLEQELESEADPEPEFIYEKAKNS